MAQSIGGESPESNQAALYPEPIVGVLDGQQLFYFLKQFTRPGEKLLFATGAEDRGERLGKAEKDQRQYSQKYDNINSVMSWLQERSNLGCACWVTVQEVSGKGAAITSYRAVCAEMARQVTDWPLPPSLAVQTSPSNFDYYWLVDGVLDPETYAGLARRLVKQWAADAASLDGSKVRRLPGSWNRKAALGDSSWLAKLVSDEGKRYSPDMLATAFPPMSREEAAAEGITVAQHSKGELARLCVKMGEIDPLKDNNWEIVGRAFWHETEGSEKGFTFWKNWAPEARAEECKKYWPSFALPMLDGSQPTGATIYQLAATRIDKTTGEIRVVPKDVLKERDGKPETSIENLTAYLEYRQIKLRWNSFTRRTEVEHNGQVQNLGESVSNNLRLEAERSNKLRFQKEWFGDAVDFLARQNTWHSIRDGYFSRLQWDGQARIDRLLIDYLGAKDTELHRAYARKFMIGAALRVLKPGCKFDTMLVLEGPQGAGKSEFCEALCGKEWFSDSLFIASSPKLTGESTAGKWILEYAELNGMGERRRDAIKAFLSRNTDTYVAKYEKLAEDAPRQFVCIGTTNDKTYLDDPTGNRRFWGVEVEVSFEKNAALRRDRDHFWAEAVALAQQGESPVLPQHLWAEQAKQAANRVNNDAWYESLGDLIPEDFRGFIATSKLWQALGINSSMKDARAGKRLGEAMTRLGFRKYEGRKRVPGNDTPVSCYFREGWIGEAPWLDIAPSIAFGDTTPRILEGEARLALAPADQGYAAISAALAQAKVTKH